jgi:hypothetical protein
VIPVTAGGIIESCPKVIFLDPESGIGEKIVTAAVVPVEMGAHDIVDIRWAESERRELTGDRLGLP